jgi:hypothetical protein
MPDQLSGNEARRLADALRRAADLADEADRRLLPILQSYAEMRDRISSRRRRDRSGIEARSTRWAGRIHARDLQGIDPDVLVKSGTYFAGQPVVLTDGRQVGRVLSNARSPVAFHAAGQDFPIETPVIEILWHSASFQKAAEEADLRLDRGRILLVGEEPTRKAERPGWGQRLVAGQTIRFI